MSQTLIAPDILCSYFDESFEPPLPAMCLHWDTEEAGEETWELPEGVAVTGPPPRRFGIDFRRQGSDAYAVRLLWDRTRLTWPAASREQLLGSALAPLLAALGTDLWCLLDQPLPDEPVPLRAA
jgi:hypothetical protein